MDTKAKWEIDIDTYKGEMVTNNEAWDQHGITSGQHREI